MAETTTPTDTFDLDSVRPSVEQMDRNRDRTNWSQCDDECLVCAKGMKRDRQPEHVHLLVSGHLTSDRDYEGEESQGWFPVGSECARKIPARFRFKMES